MLLSVSRHTSRLAATLGAAVAGAILVGGCAGPLQRPSAEARRGTHEQLEGAGGTWALVMDSPRTAAWIDAAGEEPSAWTEYARNDASLAYRPEQPLLATTEWPERERADLYYTRRVALSTRAEDLTFFDYESRYYPYGRNGAGTYRGALGPYNVGTYGFWR